MAGPAMAIGIILLAVLLLGVLAFIFYLLYFAIVYRHKKMKAILAGILAVCLIAFIIFLYLGEKEADRQFLGDYKLNRLDGRKCENCIVRLNEDYTYDIFVSGQFAGKGK